MKTKDELIEWLRDAYAMEKAMEVTLKKQIENQSISRLVREQSAVHLAETRQHAELVAACLKRLGSETSTLKTAMAKGLEIMKGASTAFAGDHRVKDLLGMCATEQFEIACYTALRAGAARFGIFEIVDTCNQIIKEEQRMADWLEANLPHVVMGYLEEAVPGPKSSSTEAEDEDMPDSAPQVAHDGLQAHPRSEALGQPPVARVKDEQAEFVLSPARQGEPAGSPPRAPSKDRGRRELQTTG